MRSQSRTFLILALIMLVVCRGRGVAARLAHLLGSEAWLLNRSPGRQS
jgi:hypothetical protein